MKEERDRTFWDFANENPETILWVVFIVSAFAALAVESVCAK